MDQNKKNTVIILNDLRSIPLISVIKLKRSINGSRILAHESLFASKEYADYTNIYWKTFLKIILVFFYGLKVLKRKNTKLSEPEKMGFYSSLFSIVEDTSASPDKYPNIYAQIMDLALGSKDVVDHLKNEKADLVFVFNGRTASSYLISKYCVNSKVDIVYYEYAGHDNGFRLFSVPPHASGRLGSLMLPYFQNGIYSLTSLKIASDLIKFQKLNSIYKSRTNKKANKSYDVAIFLGSDFEYTAVDPEICEVTWRGNPEFCKSVIEKYGNQVSYVIRCHPNSSSDPNWLELFKELKAVVDSLNASVEIIPPDSPIDSHDLIYNSKQVVTDLSTISLDAILLDKPTDIFGNTDIRYIYTNPWFIATSNGNIKSEIIKPFALVHNFLVFRFNLIERIVSNFIFFINAVFAKINKLKRKK